MTTAPPSPEEVEYCGLFDDMVALYPWGYELNIDFINSQLVNWVLFGRPQLINDGYLLLSEAGRTALCDEGKSPLRALIEVGFVRLLTRNKGQLEKVPEIGAAQGIESYKRLLETPEWTSGRLPHLLSLIGSEKRNREKWVSWPPVEMSLGYWHLIKSLPTSSLAVGLNGSVSDGQWVDILQAFDAAMESNPRRPARSAFTTCAKSIMGERSTALLPLMHVANEVYHYNMAACIHDTGMVTSVGTRYSAMMREMREQPSIGQQRDILAALTEFRSRLPAALCTLPPEALAAIVDPNGKILARKQRYLAAIDGLAGGDCSLASFKVAEAEYGEALRSVLGDAIARSAPSTTSQVAWAVVGGGLGTLVPSLVQLVVCSYVPTFTAVAASSIAGAIVAGSLTATPLIVRTFRMLPKGIPSDPEFSVGTLTPRTFDAPHSAGSHALNGAAVARFRAAIDKLAAKHGVPPRNS